MRSRDTRSSFLPPKGLDDTPLNFGKYKGSTPREIAKDDPSYITWLRANVLPAVVSKELALECEDAQDDRDVDEWDDSDEPGGDALEAFARSEAED